MLKGIVRDRDIVPYKEEVSRVPLKYVYFNKVYDEFNWFYQWSLKFSKKIVYLEQNCKRTLIKSIKSYKNYC